MFEEGDTRGSFFPRSHTFVHPRTHAFLLHHVVSSQPSRRTHVPHQCDDKCDSVKDGWATCPKWSYLSNLKSKKRFQLTQSQTSLSYCALLYTVSWMGFFVGTVVDTKTPVRWWKAWNLFFWVLSSPLSLGLDSPLVDAFFSQFINCQIFFLSSMLLLRSILSSVIAQVNDGVISYFLQLVVELLANDSNDLFVIQSSPNCKRYEV